MQAGRVDTSARFDNEAYRRVLSSCPVVIVPRRRYRGVVRTGQLLLLPCLPERVAVHDLLGRGLTAAGRVQGGAATPPYRPSGCCCPYAKRCRLRNQPRTT